MITLCWLCGLYVGGYGGPVCDGGHPRQRRHLPHHRGEGQAELGTPQYSRDNVTSKMLVIVL